MCTNFESLIKELHVSVRIPQSNIYSRALVCSKNCLVSICWGSLEARLYQSDRSSWEFYNLGSVRFSYFGVDVAIVTKTILKTTYSLVRFSGKVFSKHLPSAHCQHFGRSLEMLSTMGGFVFWNICNCLFFIHHRMTFLTFLQNLCHFHSGWSESLYRHLKYFNHLPWTLLTTCCLHLQWQLVAPHEVCCSPASWYQLLLFTLTLCNEQKF